MNALHSGARQPNPICRYIYSNGLLQGSISGSFFALRPKGKGGSPRHGPCFTVKKMYPTRCCWSAWVAAWAMWCSIRCPFPLRWKKVSCGSPVQSRAKRKKRVLREIREVPGVLKVEELLTYENRRNGRSIPKLLGGLAGAAVLLAVASGHSHSASRRAAA